MKKKYVNVNQYALYKGEKLLSTGTIREISEELNIKVQTVRKYGTPSYLKALEREGYSTYNAMSLVKLGKGGDKDVFESDM